MNSKMLMLGILLLAGLSFAMTPNWMMYVADRYGCNYEYNSEGWEDIGLYSIAGNYDDGYWNFRAMKGYLEDMSWAVWDDGSGGMCEYSGCWDPPYAPDFRSSMLDYNVAAAGFKAEFLAGLRAYLADGGSRTDILLDMNDAMADYRDCLAYASEEGPCKMCRVD